METLQRSNQSLRPYVKIFLFFLEMVFLFIESLNTTFLESTSLNSFIPFNLFRVLVETSFLSDVEINEKNEEEDSDPLWFNKVEIIIRNMT